MTEILMLNAAQETLLAHLARNGLMQNRLPGIVGSAVYQVREGWQLATLRERGELAEAADSEAFEAAVQDPDVAAILIPRTAAITREIAERTLDRNGRVMTVFWEV